MRRVWIILAALGVIALGAVAVAEALDWAIVCIETKHC